MSYKEPDYVLFLLVSILIIIGIIFSYSLSIYVVQFHGQSQFHYFIRQLFVGFLSIIIMWTLAHTKPNKSIPFLGWSFFYIFLFLMLLMPFLPSSIVPTIGGAKRWIKIPGFSLSPVEFFKIGYIYFLSWSFTRRVMNHKKSITLKKEFILLLPYFCVFLIIVILVAFLQKDFGQIVLLGIVLTIIMFLSNRSIKLFLSILVLALTLFIFLVISAPHRINRIKSWWSMVQDKILTLLPDFVESKLRIEDFPEPYQVSHSINAIYNGGLFGKGIGNGKLKLGYLSDVHTDFVLAGILEEIGLIGLGIIILIYLIVLIKILVISIEVKNSIHYLFCIAVASLILFSFLINSFGISGMIPIKGLAVPFLSYGGSSLLSLSIAMGLILSISRGRNIKT